MKRRKKHSKPEKPSICYIVLHDESRVEHVNNCLVGPTYIKMSKLILSFFILLCVIVTFSFCEESDSPYYYYVPGYYAYYENEIQSGLNLRRNSGELAKKAKKTNATGKSNKEPVTAELGPGINQFTNPNTAATILTNLVIGYISTQVTWVILHFLLWDYSTTQPAEEFSFTAVNAYLSNVNVAVYNQLLILGTSLAFSLIFLLPPLILNIFPNLQTAIQSLDGKKQRRRKRRGITNWLWWPDENSLNSRASPTFTEVDPNALFRRVFCPFCVARIITFNTLALIANVLLWSLTPYLGAVDSTRKKRRKKRQLSPLHDDAVRNHEETLIKALSKYE